VLVALEGLLPVLGQGLCLELLWVLLWVVCRVKPKTNRFDCSFVKNHLLC